MYDLKDKNQGPHDDVMVLAFFKNEDQEVVFFSFLVYGVCGQKQFIKNTYGKNSRKL